MRVAVVTQYFPTSVQPWAGHSAYQTLRLVPSKLDVHVFYPEAIYPQFLRPASAKRPPLDRAWQPQGVGVTYVPYRALPLVSRLANGFTMARRLLPYVRDFRPDIIFNYTAYPDGLAAVRIAKRLGVPSVLTAIGSDLNRIDDRFRRVQTQQTLHDADVVTAVSRDLARTAVRLGANPDSTRAIVNGCDTLVFHPGDRAEARVSLNIPDDTEAVVYVGRLDIRKGLAELVEATASLMKQRPRLRTFLVGDGPDRPQITALAERLGLKADGHQWLTLVPACLTAEVAQWMTAANLVTLPSYNEGCPNVVLEALASGRPVVATEVGGIPEIMDETAGRLVPARDAPSLAAALDAVLAATWDPDAIAAQHHRSWQNVADDVTELLLRVGTRKQAAASIR